jgi:CheY-like chemotaxis protein
MDGIQATRIIRERERGRGTHTPVVALTAHARQEDEEMCRTAGMDGFLSKPVTIEQLHEAVVRFGRKGGGKRVGP